jgi:hypothetical protein
MSSSRFSRACVQIHEQFVVYLGWALKGLTYPSQIGRSLWTRGLEKFGPPEEPANGGRRPHNNTVVWSLIGFILFGGFVAVAATYSERWTRFSVGATGLALLIFLAGVAVFDVLVQTSSEYMVHREGACL